MARSGTWEELEVRGRESPLPFKGLSGAGIRGKAYFFGGYGGGYSDETHVLDLERPLEPEWSVLQVTSDRAPSRRAYHSTFAYKESLWVFGGVGTRGYSNDVWRLTFEDARGGAGRWVECPCVGRVPRKREGHTGTVVDSTLVVYGGYDGCDWLGDVFALNLETLIWWRAAGGDAPNAPTPRSGHAAAKAPLEWDAVFVFGGFNGDGCVNEFAACLEIDVLAGTAAWEPIEPKGAAPSKRYGHSAVVYNTSVYVFGGTGPVTGYGADITGAVCHNDMCVFSLLQPHKPVWRRDPHGHAFPGEPPSARHCHGAAMVGNNMVLVGGSTRGPYCARDAFPKLLNDVHCLSLGNKVDGDYVRSRIIIHSNQSKHRHPTRIFELKDITSL